MQCWWLSKRLTREGVYQRGFHKYQGSCSPMGLHHALFPLHNVSPWSFILFPSSQSGISIITFYQAMGGARLAVDAHQRRCWMAGYAILQTHPVASDFRITQGIFFACLVYSIYSMHSIHSLHSIYYININNVYFLFIWQQCLFHQIHTSSSCFPETSQSISDAGI